MNFLSSADVVQIDEPYLQARPEQTFFPASALDRAFGVVMALATEVQVLRDRVAAGEERAPRAHGARR